MKKWCWVCLWTGFAFTYGEAPMPDPPGVLQLASPVRHTISVSGSFGELRHNHFHGGIDIRAGRGAGGDDILAAAPGYISKIDIDAENLGKSLYITHPNGFVTVYAHLDGFRADLADCIRQEQFAQRQFQLSMEFDPEHFPVREGDLVAYMGNTGSSRGKHLHFELRDPEGEEVWDPLLFGLPLADGRAPVIRNVKFTGYDREGLVVSQKVLSASAVRKQPRIRVPGAWFTISVDAADRTDHSGFVTGIKTLRMEVDGTERYAFSAERWRRDETRYINAHVETGRGGRSWARFHRCYLLCGNRLGLYNTCGNAGFVAMEDTVEHRVELSAGDACGNQARLSFFVEKAPFTPGKVQSCKGQCLYPDQELVLEGSHSQFAFREGSVYDAVTCKLEEASVCAPGSYSPLAGVSPHGMSLHHPVTIRLKPGREIPEALRSKCYIAQKSGKVFINSGGRWEGDWLVAESRSAGPFCIRVDTVAPNLQLLRPRRKSQRLDALRFRLTDNVGAIREVQDLSYQAYIDDQWILMEYDKKNRLIHHAFEEWLTPGQHSYRVVVCDPLGNEKTYRGNFVR